MTNKCNVYAYRGVLTRINTLHISCQLASDHDWYLSGNVLFLRIRTIFLHGGSGGIQTQSSQGTLEFPSKKDCGKSFQRLVFLNLVLHWMIVSSVNQRVNLIIQQIPLYKQLHLAFCLENNVYIFPQQMCGSELEPHYILSFLEKM